MLDQAFADIGLAFSQMLGGPYHVAQTIEQTDPVYDDGGSIVTPGSVVHRSCSVQIDVATQAMREAEGYVDTDVRFIVLAARADGE